MIELVITGGQTGADQAAWRAARRAGIACAGWMPLGFRTEEGPRPEFAELYGAREYDSPEYPPRTRANILAADGSLLFGDDTTRGAQLLIATEREIGPYCAVRRPPPLRLKVYHPDAPACVARWIDLWRIGRLLVAGNRESRALGIGAWVERYLAEVFRVQQERSRE